MPTPLSSLALKQGAQPRAAAAVILENTIARGRSTSDTVPGALNRIPDQRDQGLVQELAYGVLRQYFVLEQLVAPLLRHPLKSRDGDVYALLLIGVYQLKFLDTPAHAAISATVDAARALGKPWASALVNGVLRAYLRRSQELLALVGDSPIGRYSHPEWLIRHLQEAWPGYWEDILNANNQRAPMTLRVNVRRLARSEYLKRLHARGLNAAPCSHSPSGILLAQPVEVETLPGFRQGDVSVQDEGAQLAAPLLNLSSGQRVLDACAAPGGKTAHILELAPQLSALTALDCTSTRLDRLRDNLKRLRLSCQVMQGNALTPRSWWDGKLFHRILLDAPCSGTGVIRRHPDIKLLRRASDVCASAEQQFLLLQALWPLLTTGGELLYASCSVLPQENKEIMQRFLSVQKDARLDPIIAPWGHETGFGRQIVTGESAMDGFFYARLYKFTPL
ncbi:MAG: 16S rRNA (cytosine(967)-C(5))-methyltransferase RsmB [Gammaproteobacteria bacterium]